MRPSRKVFGLLTKGCAQGKACPHLWAGRDLPATSLGPLTREVSTEGQAESGSRTHLLFVGSYASSFGPANSSRQKLDFDAQHPGGNSTTRGQLFMSGSQVTQGFDGDTSEGTSDEETSETLDIKYQMLEGALRHVDTHGWSSEAVQKAAQELNLSPSAASMFERPEAALVMHFVEKCNAELSERLERNKAALSGMRTPERVQTALQWRLEMLMPYMSSWPQAMAIQLSPGCLPTTVKHLFSMISDVWYSCGDTAADLSWYNKRLILAGVYTQTELFMLTDYSPGYADTWESLGRRCQEMEGMSKLSKRAKESFRQMGDLLKHAAGDSGMYVNWAKTLFSEQLRKSR